MVAHTRAHSGNMGNELVDKLAGDAKEGGETKGEWEELGKLEEEQVLKGKISGADAIEEKVGMVRKLDITNAERRETERNRLIEIYKGKKKGERGRMGK